MCTTAIMQAIVIELGAHACTTAMWDRGKAIMQAMIVAVLSAHMCITISIVAIQVHYIDISLISTWRLLLYMCSSEYPVQ